MVRLRIMKYKILGSSQVKCYGHEFMTNSTLDRGFLYCKDISIQPQGYIYASWAGNSMDRRSTSGFMFMLGSAAILLSSKKQPTVALSNTEAELHVRTD
jgi:hypothetical protein